VPSKVLRVLIRLFQSTLLALHGLAGFRPGAQTIMHVLYKSKELHDWATWPSGAQLSKAKPGVTPSTVHP
jgi:hypothetical protein